MKDFKGKTALITGAAYGFGREFVKQAAARGMKIAAVDIIGDVLEEVIPIAKECGAEDIITIQADVSIYEETEKVVAAVLEKYGTIDLLMNNAGVAVPGNGINLPLRDWEWIVQTNLMSHIYFMRQVIPVMMKQGTHCNIMNTCSIAGIIYFTGMAPYFSTKHAAVALSECVNYELQALGADIAMGVFCPGYVQTHLDHSEEYRPERFKDDSDPYYQSKEFAEGQAAAKYVIETGLPLEGFGETVFKAIEEDQFYVLTHPQYDGMLQLQTGEKLKRANPNLAQLVAAIKGA
ncbi:MAG: SDR family NAD(P)-dependent oxidoreductase [Eubacterium sp.]|nr:SDR family NAD(P)-dependent oxidoreductase [Eubacterium sp.]